MTTFAQWVSGARPRTLPAAVVPVLIGVAVATDYEPESSRLWPNSLLALVVSVALQVAVNYANDYSDGIRGTDDSRRGPLRLTASGTAAPQAVKRAAFAAFGLAAIAGAALAARTTWWLVPLGVVCIVAGWTYTGGPKPYGYAGLGEVFVFVFFGLVATAGTTFVVSGAVTRLSLTSGAMAGFLAMALLVVNNIRDIDTDVTSGKRTLAVRLGHERARHVYAACFLGAGLSIAVAALDVPFAVLGLAGLLAALPAISAVRSTRSPAVLIGALGKTARIQLVVGALYSLGLVIQ
jgi:1,4-dihydroxy-2-naphthoate octaprenyltransferase